MIPPLRVLPFTTHDSPLQRDNGLDFAAWGKKIIPSFHLMKGLAMKMKLFLVAILSICAGAISLFACAGGDDDDSRRDGGDMSDDDISVDDDMIVVWTDSSSGLMWQNGPDVGSVAYALMDSKSYCEALGWGGYEDWRLPTISELRSLVRGCDVTVAGGDCDVADDCLSYPDCRNDSCSGCGNLAGPGPGGAYWPQEISGKINWYWTWSEVENSYGLAVWIVDFNLGEVNNGYYGGGEVEFGRVRCVRKPNGEILT
jgi:hypothetical protein